MTTSVSQLHTSVLKDKYKLLISTCTYIRQFLTMEAQVHQEFLMDKVALT
jgi:hypothetical protein